MRRKKPSRCALRTSSPCSSRIALMNWTSHMDASAKQQRRLEDMAIHLLAICRMQGSAVRESDSMRSLPTATRLLVSVSMLTRRPTGSSSAQRPVTPIAGAQCFRRIIAKIVPGATGQVGPTALRSWLRAIASNVSNCAHFCLRGCVGPVLRTAMRAALLYRLLLGIRCCHLYGSTVWPTLKWMRQRSGPLELSRIENGFAESVTAAALQAALLPFVPPAVPSPALREPHGRCGHSTGCLHADRPAAASHRVVELRL